MSDHAVPVAPQRPYWYRRPLRPRELLPAVGAAIGAGLAAFYVARLFLERTPLVATEPGRRPSPSRSRRVARDAGTGRAVFRR